MKRRYSKKSVFHLKSLKLDSIILIGIKPIDLNSTRSKNIPTSVFSTLEFTSVLSEIVSVCPFLNVFHLLAKITCTIISAETFIILHHVRHSNDAKIRFVSISSIAL